MIKNLLGLVALAFIGFNLNIPAQAVRVSNNDIVCSFKYQVGNNPWRLDSTGGTTRAQARNFQTLVIQRLERQASETGQDFQFINLGCEDPYGAN